MSLVQLRGWFGRTMAAVSVGRELVAAFEEAAEDGAITEAELGALSVRAVRLYEAATGRTLIVTAIQVPQ